MGNRCHWVQIWKIDIKSESQFREIMMQAQNEQEAENEENQE